MSIAMVILWSGIGFAAVAIAMVAWSMARVSGRISREEEFEADLSDEMDAFVSDLNRMEK